MQSDASLVRQAVAGDRFAYGQLYDRFARLVRSLCFDTTGNLTCAQDLAQEVFLRAYTKLDELRDPERFSSWLIGITRHVCLDWRRARSRDRHTYVGAAPEVAAPEPAADGDTSVTELRRAIVQLPERERLALHVFYLEDRPAEDACQVLGLSSSGFYKLLERARNRLAKILQRNEGPIP